MSIPNFNNYLVIIISVIALLIVFATVLFVYYLLMKLKYANKNLEYDFKNKRVELEEMRDYFESKIYDLNNKLIATEDRWKDTNHLLLSSQNSLPFDIDKKSIYLTDFLNNFGILDKDITVKKDLVFVLTPFHEEMRNVYNVISNVCTNVGLRALRGDEEFIQGDILPHILKLIIQARIVIANIDGRNPNVFYELGISHALNKPTILISKSINEVPFDVKSKNIILYADEVNLRNELSNYLTRILVKEAIPRLEDNIDIPFKDDPDIIGKWKTIDYVKSISDYREGVKSFSGELFIKELVFKNNGFCEMPWYTWTRGYIIHHGDKTASKYILKKTNDRTIMFFEWKSGDYTIRHMEPWYYVLEKIE